MTSLTDLSDAELAEAVGGLGGKPFQARQIAHWLWRHGVTDYAAMTNVPARLRDGLAARFALQGTTVARPTSPTTAPRSCCCGCTTAKPSNAC